MDVVSRYLDDILTPTLLERGVSESFTQYTVETVAMQMNSLLRHWDDRKFRNTILLVGLEEGSFYEPAAKLEVRCFVVVTLRNSPIEVIQSHSCGDAGLKHFLSNQDVKNITSAAVQYFAQQSFEKMCRQAKSMHSRDIYEELREKFPVAWMSMQTAATTKAKVVDYPKQMDTSPYIIEEVVGESSSEDEKPRVRAVVSDGYDPTMDRDMMEILGGVEATNSYLITDSFKGLTRNIEKLFRIIEFLLTRGIPFVTANFYLENGHIEKRMKLLRAGHTLQETKNNLSQTLGLGYKHNQALRQYLKRVD